MDEIALTRMLEDAGLLAVAGVVILGLFGLGIGLWLGLWRSTWRYVHGLGFLYGSRGLGFRSDHTIFHRALRRLGVLRHAPNESSADE